MENDELNLLLNKYYEGETSESEDQLLEHLLTNKKDANENIPEQHLMSFFANERATQLSSGFDLRFEEAIGETSQRKTKVMQWRIGVAASLVLLVVALYWIGVGDQGSSIKTISTGSTEKKDIQLPDGSMVSLNHNTTIHYNEHFKPREVTLAGEAYFNVTPDKNNPFRINSAGTVSEVVGTSFNLLSNDGNKVVELTVVTGSVAFSTFKDQLLERLILSEGNRAIFDKRKNAVKKYETTDPNILAWKTGAIVFDDATMQEVTLVLGKYFDKQIVTDNNGLLNCHFKAKFQQPTLSEVLDLLNFTMNIKSEIKGDTLKLYGKTCAQ
jgi:ferric-dicitrate binding protein FerR (iron transport regulator)